MSNTAALPSGTLPACLFCRHLRPDPGDPLTCEAFPDGVPDPIRDGRVNHRDAYPGDRGMRFEPDPLAPAEAIALLPRGTGPIH